MSSKINKEWFVKNLWLGPVLAGLLLRLYKITASSIWHDEGYTMWLIRYNWSEILTRTARDVHPPLYYFISKAWVSVAGSSVFSIRFLSLLFSLGIVYLTYLIVKTVWNEKAAFWGSLFVALSPFMVRFGQEARMYGVVAFFTTLATYFFVRYIKDQDKKWLIWYALAMLAGMYTQYYAFFVIISHWVILSLYTPGFWKFDWKKSFGKVGVWDGWWWLANVAMLALYVPWFPIAYQQVTRVSGSYWIKPEWITIRTIPNNVLQFITYTHFDQIYNYKYFGPVVYWFTVIMLIGSGFYLLKKSEKRAANASALIFGLLPMILVFTLSKLRTPVYQDRYFPFSAVALFAVWGILVSKIESKKVRILAGSIAIMFLLAGNLIMHIDVNHQMREVKDVLALKQKGDAVVSGELYTFLDGSYYLGYGNLKLVSDPVDGYGESSLFYDQQDKYVVTMKELQAENDRVWMIGKTGDKDYFSDKTWADWSQTTYFKEEGKSNGLKVVFFERID